MPHSHRRMSRVRGVPGSVGAASTAPSGYSLAVLWSTLRRVAADYQITRQPERLVLIALTLAAARTLSVAATVALGAFAAAPAFSWSRFVAMRATSTAADLVDSMPDALLESCASVTQANHRLVETLLFGEADESRTAAITDLVAATERGKAASRDLLIGTVTTVGGAVLSVIASLAFLTAINPVMGVVGTASVPVMCLAARRAAIRSATSTDATHVAEQAARRHIAHIAATAEVIATSPAAAAIGRELVEALGAADTHRADRGRRAAMDRMAGLIPYQCAAAAAGVIGAVPLHLSLGAIFASMLIIGWLYFPARQLLRHYAEVAPPLVGDVLRMYGVLDEGAARARRGLARDASRVDARTVRDHGLRLDSVVDPRIARASVSVVIPDGRWMAVTGRSGSGKSTLLRIIAGATAPARGTVHLGGIAIDNVARFDDGTGRLLLHDLVFHLPQEPALLADMSVIANLVLGSRLPLSAAKRSDVRARAWGVLADLGLNRLASDLDRPLGNISGGEAIRLGFGRIAFRSARVLILDEPTRGLDPQATQAVIGVLQRLRARGMTIITATHDPRVIAAADGTLAVDATAAGPRPASREAPRRPGVHGPRLPGFGRAQTGVAGS